MHLNSTAQEKREGVDTNSMPPRAHEKKNSAWQSLHHADVPTQKKNQITRILNRSRIRFIKAGRFYPRRGQDKNTLRKRFWKGNLRWEKRNIFLRLLHNIPRAKSSFGIINFLWFFYLVGAGISYFFLFPPAGHNRLVWMQLLLRSDQGMIAVLV